MDHSNIFKPKSLESQQSGYTRPAKCIPAKKNQVSFKSEDEDVPDGIPLKPVFHKITLNPGPGHAEDRGDKGKSFHRSKAPVGGSSLHHKSLIYGATDVNRSRQSRQDLDWLPDEQWRLAKAIHNKELLLQEKLWKTAQSMRKIIHDKESSETWSQEPIRRRDAGMRTERSGGNPHEGKSDKWNTQEGKTTEKALRPGRREQPGDYRTRANGHLDRRGEEGRNAMESHNKERSKRSLHASAKMRGESQWSQATANEEEEEEQQQHGSSCEEKERVGQQRSVLGRSAEHHSGKERPYLPRFSWPQVADPVPEEKTAASPPLLPCQYCKRRFAPARLERHVTICERLHQSQRKPYDSFKHRIQGTDMEIRRYSGTSVGSEKSTGGEKRVSDRNARQAGQSGRDGSSPQVTCPHCCRCFAPGPAERHIPKCRDVRSRPPPPSHLRQKHL